MSFGGGTGVARLGSSEFRDDSDTMNEQSGGLDYLAETALSRSDLPGLERFVPPGLRDLENPQSALPRIAKDKNAIQAIEASIQEVPTTHSLHFGRCSTNSRSYS